MQIAALWDPLPDSSPCTPTRWCPVGRGPSGGPGSIPGLFWRTGVPSIRRYSAEPLHSGSVKYRCRLAIAMTIVLLGPWPWAPEKKKTYRPGLYIYIGVKLNRQEEMQSEPA